MPRVDCVKLEMGAFKLNMCHFSDGSPYYDTGQEGVEIWTDFSWIKIFLGYSDVLTIVRGKSFAKLSRKCSLSSKRKFFYQFPVVKQSTSSTCFVLLFLNFDCCKNQKYLSSPAGNKALLHFPSWTAIIFLNESTIAHSLQSLQMDQKIILSQRSSRTAWFLHPDAMLFTIVTT